MDASRRAVVPLGRGVRVAAASTDTALLRRRFDAALAAFLDRQRRSGIPGDLYAALRRFALADGKRLRPLFCYWGWRGIGAPDGEPIIVAAAALELFHAFALIHDDILDRSDRRRGQPCLHRVFADLYGRCGRRGDPEAYGRNAALLCGDLCAAWSAQMFHGCGIDGERLRRGQEVFARMRAEVIAGEYLDVLSATGDGSVDAALTVIRMKTARYTVTRPVQIGAALAGAARDVVTAMADFTDPLGDAFQLRDDLLGVFGDPAVTGKSDLDDLREGKTTVLMALTRAAADRSQAARLRSLVGDPGLDRAGAARVRRIIEDTGARQRVEEMIQLRVEQSRAALDRLPLTESARSVMAELTARVTHRRR